MKTFTGDYLAAEMAPGLKAILYDLSRIAQTISLVLKGDETGYSDSKNVYGEKQLKLDILSNNIFIDTLKKNKHVAMMASEELEEAVETGSAEGEYSVAFDPLDGSSLVDVNLSVGSIISVYKGKGFIGRKASEQVAAMIVVYGPRLSFLVSIGNGVDEFTFTFKGDGGAVMPGDFVCTSEKMTLKEEGKIFAPGNLRACSSEKWYVDLLNHWVTTGYTLRYSGGMVPDVNQILKKGGGIFTYPGYKEMPEGKLRLLYECAPMAFLVEQAGGLAVHKTGRILDIEVTKLDQRTPIFLGSTKEVELVQKYMN